MIKMKAQDYRIIWKRDEILAQVTAMGKKAVQRLGAGSPPQQFIVGGDTIFVPGIINPNDPQAPRRKPGSTQDVQPLLDLLPPAPP